jgi:hypothetical protein
LIIGVDPRLLHSRNHGFFTTFRMTTVLTDPSATLRMTVMSTRDFGLYSSGRKAGKLSRLREERLDMSAVFLDRLKFDCIL